jgi:hypothetical protein
MHKPFPGNRLNRWLAMMLTVLLSTSAALAQSTANYTFATTSTGSLVDMSTGTTDALATGTYRDDDASTVQSIGFTFGFMGTNYTQFSVNSNGQLRLGATAISGTNATPSSGQAILAPFGGDNATQATGAVRYKVVAGTNRTLVVEWTGLRVPYAGSPGAGTPTQVQAILEENTGKVEYRYGGAFNNGTTVTRSIFISAGTAAGQIGVVKTFNATPTYDATVTSATTTSLADNAAIAVLNSTADGARTTFSFTPPSGTPAAPTVTASAITPAGLTLTITDNSTNEGYYTVSRSTDNTTFTVVGTVLSTAVAATGGTVTFTQTGLTAATTYYYRVTANNEAGGVSGNATLTTATVATVPVCGTKSVGPGATADYASLTAAFTVISLNGLCGPLVLELQAAYVSTVETFPLVYNYAGTATNTVTVRPAAGANSLSITSTVAGAAFNIFGGKYLIVDGRPGGSGSTVSGAALATDLTIASTSTTGIPLQFTSDATFNTVQHTQIVGVGNNVSSYPNVNFTGTVGTLGNSDNTLQYNNVTAGATTPVSLLYSGNSLNSRNSIIGNNFSNFYLSGGSAYGININAAGTGWVISGNSIYQTASRTSTAGTLYGINIVGGGGYTITNNFIGGTAPNAGGTALTATGTAAAFRFSGIFLTLSGAVSSVQGNTVANINWISSSGASTTYGIVSGIYISAGDANIGTTTGNTIGTAAGPITVNTSTTGGYSFGISSNSSGTVAITGNTISNITGVGSAATVASNVAGILVSAGTTNTISRNKIYALAAGSGVANISTGIWLTGGTTNNVNNNLIGDLQASTSTSLVAVSGLLIGGGTTNNVYYNTINLNATSTGATFGTSGIYLNSTTATTDLRNNIVVNKSTAVGTGGYTAALRRVSGTAGTVPSNLAATSNNNLYYAGTPSATNVIYVEGTTSATNAQQTLLAYKGFLLTREQASVTEDVPFVSTTGSAATFLHINPATPTQVEGTASVIASITTDFDGDTRSTTAPDLGADEGTFTPQDLSGPTITYTALGIANVSVSTRTLVATITDASGIGTGANAPRLFYRRGTSGAFTSVAATSVSGSAYTFTLDYATLTGVVAGDVIQYYVAAQDALGNASTSPVGGNFTTAPTVLNQYLVTGTLAGVYYVGTSTSPDATRTFPTLTVALNAYNQYLLGGAVTFLLLDAAYSATTGETFPLVVFNNADASATNSLTIRPNTGVTATVTAAGSVMALAGSRYVTIDGSNTAGGTTRDLTLVNSTSTANTYGLGLLIQTGIAQANLFATVRNLNVTGGGATTNANYGIILSGADNDNVTLQNNRILGVTTGIQAAGTTLVSVGGLDNLVISGNVVGPATATTGSNINLQGILVSNTLAPSVTNNTVQNVVGAGSLLGLQVQNSSAPTITGNSAANVTSSAAGAVGFGAFALTGGTFSQNQLQGLTGNSSTALSAGLLIGSGTTGLVVDRNRFTGLTEVNTGGNGVKGIEIQTGQAAANLRISNNFVQIAAASGFSGTTYSNIGIRLSGTQAGISLYYNSVNLTGTDIYNTTTLTAGLVTLTGSTALDIRNNIFRNSVNNTGNTGAKAYAFYSTAPVAAFTNLNNNDYFVSGTQGVLAYFAGADVTTLAALRTATTQDANSLNVDPAFVSATDLHTAAPALNAAGTPIASVTTDIDGDTRSTTLPDIGADEFIANLDVSVAALTAPVANSTCFGTTEAVTASITNSSTAALNFATTPVTVTVTITPTAAGGAAQTFTTVVNTGTLAAGASQAVTFATTADLSAPGTYTAVVTTSLTGDDNPANNALAPVTITSGTRSATFSYPTANICAGTTGTVAATLGTGATAGTFTSTTGLTIDATTGTITPATSTAGTYTVTNTLPATATCPALTTTQSVTISPATSAAFSYTGGTFCVSGTTAPVATVTGTAGGTFTSTTGLTIDATTGAITLASSTPGTYTVTYSVAGACSSTSTQSVTITAAPVAAFSYTAASACAGSATLLTPTLGTGATAGAFTSTAGLTLNAATGAVNPATSTAGTYTVTNTVAASGGCAAATSTATVTINALPATPTYSYTYPTRSTVLFTSSVAPAGTTYQWYVGGVAITGATSQTYTANGATAPGSYTVRFLNTATGCQSAASTPLTVTGTTQALAGSSLHVFPNPTTDGQLTLQLNGYPKAVTLTVLDALGRVVLTQQVAAGQPEAKLDLSGAARGVYLLRAVTAGGTDVRRIVRE